MMTSSPLSCVGRGPTDLEVDHLGSRDGVVRLVARGEVDLSTLGGLEAAVGRAWRLLPTTVVVDLTGVTFCCIAGAGALVAARSAAAGRGVDLVLVTRPGIVRRVLHIVESFACPPVPGPPRPRDAVVPAWSL